jgi:hypothetical protein
MRFTRMMVAAGVAVAALSASARDDAASEKLGMKLGIQCYTYRALDLAETIGRAQRFGIRYVQMYPGQRLGPGGGTTGPDMSAAQVEAVKAWFGDEAGRRKLFGWARTMGIGTIATETKPDAGMAALAAEYGLQLAIHNHPNTWPPDQVAAAVRELPANVGACPDTAHWLRAGRAPVPTLELLRGRILEAHLKDLNAEKQDVVFGEGEVDIPGVLRALHAQGFKGYLFIEYERGDVAQLDEAVPACVAAFDRMVAELSK